MILFAAFYFPNSEYGSRPASLEFVLSVFTLTIALIILAVWFCEYKK
jgi:hypothetical protein